MPPGRSFNAAFTLRVALGVHFQSHLQKVVETIRRVTPRVPTFFMDVVVIYKRVTNYPKLSGSEQPFIMLIDL